MSISFGPKLNLINNANINEAYYDQLRQFLQALDQLIQMSVISATVSVPPPTPANGDAYLLLQATPSGVWAGFMGYIAVWDTQVTTSGTNTQVPAWVFYKPNAGWIVWNINTASLYVYNGTAWTSVVAGGSQAEVPTGAINGTNRAYAITFTPTPLATFTLYLNGVFQLPSVNYTLSGNSLSMNIAPSSGSTLYAVYDYV